jgi:hypothetical protein
MRRRKPKRRAHNCRSPICCELNVIARQKIVIKEKWQAANYSLPFLLSNIYFVSAVFAGGVSIFVV